jgi:transposase
MVLLGVDPHKDTHTVVAVDEAGRQLDQMTVPARTLGHGELVGWARMRWSERIWAVEDCRHVSGRLERDLLAAGERVVRGAAPADGLTHPGAARKLSPVRPHENLA